MNSFFFFSEMILRMSRDKWESKDTFFLENCKNSNLRENIEKCFSWLLFCRQFEVLLFTTVTYNFTYFTIVINTVAIFLKIQIWKLQEIHTCTIYKESMHVLVENSARCLQLITFCKRIWYICISWSHVHVVRAKLRESWFIFKTGRNKYSTCTEVSFSQLWQHTSSRQFVSFNAQHLHDTAALLVKSRESLGKVRFVICNNL